MVSGVTKSGNSNSPSSFWMLDSGASDHICTNLQSFSSYQKIKPISVQLPNGTLITTYFSGTIYFPASLYLHDVLFIPEFHYNLISIRKLASSLNCQFIFSPTSCVIQDLSSKKMIEHAKLHHNFYIFHGTPQQSFCNTVPFSIPN